MFHLINQHRLLLGHYLTLQVGYKHRLVGSSRIPVGTARVWYKCRGKGMGLAVSRSLGDDIPHQAGVSSHPDIMEQRIDASNQVEIL